MTLVHRRIIYSFFILVFIVGVPLILLSASGFRYNFLKGEIQKTGIIFVEVKPKNVTAYLNDKLIDKKVPFQVDKLIPNKYKLRLEKEGYSSWEKKVEVFEGQTTNIQYPRLFKLSEHLEPLLEEGIIMGKMNDRNSKFAYEIEDEAGYTIAIYDLRKNKVESVYSNISSLQDIEWLPGDQGLKLIYETDTKIVFLNDKSVTSLAGLISDFSERQVQYDKNRADMIYYLSNNGLVIRLNLRTEDSEVIYNDEVSDYLLKKNDLLIVKNATLGKSTVVKVDMITGREENLFLIDPESGYKLCDFESGFLIIKNISKNELAVWSKSMEEIEYLREANFFEWNHEDNELLFGNGYELWVYRLDSEEDKEKFTLLTRVSSPISEAHWYAVGTHVIYVLNGQIKITENLPVDRYKVDLIKFDEVSALSVDSKGKNIYFLGFDEDNTSLYNLYKMEIQD